MNESSNQSMFKNKNLATLAIILLVVVAVFVFLNKNKNKTAFVVLNGDATIKMGNDEYTPQNFTIKKGTKVTFVNDASGLRWPASDLHPSHLIYSDFDSKAPVSTGQSWTIQFDKVGEWGYHDHLAPYITGTIKVTE